MGSSYVDYRGHGIWATDGTVELWLLQVIEAARPEVNRAAWLAPAIDHWQLHATVGFTSCVDPALDRYLHGDPHREAAFLAILDRVTHDLTRTTAGPLAAGTSGDIVEPDVRDLLARFSATVARLVRGESDGIDDLHVFH